MPKTIYNADSDWGEGRRLRAIELKAAGWTQRQIATHLGVTPGAVSHWLKKARLHGPESLLHRRFGRASRLAPDHKQALTMILADSAASYGFTDHHWTRERVKELLCREFGVSFHVSHVGRLMRSCGLSLRRGRRRK